ncbi:MAG: TolC family protein [Bacteroidota bacterium]
MKTIKLKHQIGIFIMLLFTTNVFSQNKNEIKSFSFKQAMDYSVGNSYKTKSAALDVQATIAQRRGFISIGLPQVNASAGYQYYANIPTQFMPDFLTPAIEGTMVKHGLITPAQMSAATGEMFPIQFGSKNNMSVGASASQLLFDGTFVVGLKAAAMLVDMSKISNEKSVIEAKASVAQAYYLVLIAKENLRILDSTYINMNQILEQNKKIQANGFMDETDIEQLTLSVSNLKSKRDITEKNIQMVTNLLKFQMGIDINDSIELTDNLSSIIDQAIASNMLDKQFDVNTHFDYKLVKTGELLQKQSVKVDKAKYYPSMNLILSTSSNAQRDKFNFFNSEKWYNTTLIGVNLSVPIWSSGIRHYKIQQDKFIYEKQQIITKQVEQGLKIDFQNLKVSLKMYTDQFYTDKKNMELSNKIYNKTLIKYREGISSSMDLNQAYLQMLTQEGNYINTLLQLLNTYTSLNKALNTL